MLLRAVRCGRTLPMRKKAFVPLARRSVTTDAASAHAEKEHVPEVRTMPRVKLELLTDVAGLC